MDKQISNIVFTKNRPLQLEGYLESLYKNFKKELIQTYILYKPELFDNEYQQVFAKYSNCIVIKEADFFSDFLEIINAIDTKYILFGVDDVVYFDSVDFGIINETFNKFSDDIFGFSLRFSEQNVKKNDLISTTEIADQMIYSIDWRQGRTPTMRYPFELCATIYRTEWVKKILKSSRVNNSFCEKFFAPNSITVRVLSKIIRRHKILRRFGYFYNPNTLESWNCRWCQNHAEQLPQRLYFQKLCASAIQVNMVNTSARLEKAENSAEHTVEILAEKYREGYRLDIGAIANNRPIHTHCGKKYFKLTQTIS